jgi:hypothetical protein
MTFLHEFLFSVARPHGSDAEAIRGSKNLIARIILIGLWLGTGQRARK